MNGEEMTNEQFNKVLEMIKTIARKCKTVEEVISEIEKIQKTE